MSVTPLDSSGIPMHYIVDIIRCSDGIVDHAASGAFVTVLSNYLREETQFKVSKDERFGNSIIVEVLSDHWRTYCKYIFEQGLEDRSVFFHHMILLNMGLRKMLSVEFKRVKEPVADKYPIPPSLVVENVYPFELLQPAAEASEGLTVSLDSVVSIKSEPIVTPVVTNNPVSTPSTTTTPSISEMIKKADETRKTPNASKKTGKPKADDKQMSMF